MKRKRKRHVTERIVKKQKLNCKVGSEATLPLLRQYYPQVLTLRDYLTSRLSKASKKRRRKVLHHGLQLSNWDGSSTDLAVLRLLDTTVVGAFNSASTVDLESIDKDISIFTQQLSDTTTSISPTQGALKQSEIVDFVVWQLFQRSPGSCKPSHILCQGYQRTANNGVDLELVPGIPGIFSSCRNSYVQTLKGDPWIALSSVLGEGTERVISDLLLHCCIFVPVGESTNLNQLSGTPLCELKPLQLQRTNRDDLPPNNATTSGKIKESHEDRGLSDIRFVRHRMLYARSTLTAKGSPRYGLPTSHVLNRLRDLSAVSETVHVLKYVFPRQFGLHNVFTSSIDPKDTSQPFKDYALRDREIAQSELRRRQARANNQHNSSETKPSHLPKRLRGEAFDLIGRFRKKHLNCPYHALLQHYCPPQQILYAATQGSIHHASSAVEVSAFCRAIVSRVFPTELWGPGELGRHNTKIVLNSINHFVQMRRYESMSMHDVLQPLRMSGVPWLAPPKVESGSKLSRTDFVKRQELMAELLYYVFDSFLIQIIRGTFHVTESNVHRNQLLYFRHDVWKVMSEPALTSLKETMLEECSAATVRKLLAKRALGVSQVRMLPKEQGMRPIINLRRRVQKMQYGRLVLGRSINSILTPAFSVLNYEKDAHPDMLGSALFSVDDIFPRLQTYRKSLRQQGLSGAPLYFAKVDVQACFDTIPQKRLMALVKSIIGAEQYNVARYARAKLVGGHNKETPGFGAKPSWKFLTKATANEKTFDFIRETDVDTAEGRSRTVYVDNVVQKTERRHGVLGLLEEHVESHLIKVGSRFYRQKKGIPQGSIVSSLLCSYIYAELEREVLGFLSDGQSLLLRLIDDFLVVTSKRQVAEQFMRVMHDGVPDFGVCVKAEKSRANFDIEIGGKRIARLPAASEFPYCGNAINTTTLDISKDRERRRKTHIADSVTVEYSRLQGQTFYRKTLNALKLQMHAMLLSTSHNSLRTVFSNLYHSFSEVAQKTRHYIHSMPADKQPGDRLIIRTTDDLMKLACVLMKRCKRTSKDVLAYECAVSEVQARWLACTAFYAVFHKRQTRHRGLLAWLEMQLTLPSSKAQQKILAPVAKAYDL